MLNILRGDRFSALPEQKASISTTKSNLVYTLLNPQVYELTVEAGTMVSVVVVYTDKVESEVKIIVAEGASLDLTQLFMAEAFASTHVEQSANSESRLMFLVDGSANTRYEVDLNGAGARNRASGLFFAAGAEHSVVNLNVNHNVADCTSNSIVKGVASEGGVGEFDGLVYVAKDAQRTDARQTSRNIELTNGARIITRPQLEIYADDVKCSHGATVGQMDSDAILYMRQRGLSEAQARRLQLEGFVGEVVQDCAVEELRDAMTAQIGAKLEKM